jgi:hypothetical protein
VAEPAVDIDMNQLGARSAVGCHGREGFPAVDCLSREKRGA